MHCCCCHRIVGSAASTFHAAGNTNDRPSARSMLSSVADFCLTACYSRLLFFLMGCAFNPAEYFVV